jgi:hypothetical protein
MENGGRNIIQQRYELTEEEAGRQASYLLVGALILYPIVRPVQCRNYNFLTHAPVWTFSRSHEKHLDYRTVVPIVIVPHATGLYLAGHTPAMDSNRMARHCCIWKWIWIFSL